MRSHYNRWMKFKQFSQAKSDPPWAPTALTVSLFLTDVSQHGPTAAAGALSDIAPRRLPPAEAARKNNRERRRDRERERET